MKIRWRKLLSVLVVVCIMPVTCGVGEYYDFNVETVVIKESPILDIRGHGAAVNGATDDTSAVQSAIDAAFDAGGGVVFFPEGTTVIDNVTIKSNVTLAGTGWTSILKQKTGAWHVARIADGTSNVAIRDLAFQGTVAADGFQEVYHLLFTAGVTNLNIERVKFSGPRGDALYIGTGNERGQDSTANGHNKNVWVHNSYFDGEAKDNRQGISVIDCDGCWIENNYFTRLSKSGMPGAIDIEPDSGGTPAGTGSVIRNINILNNRFYDSAGESVIAMNFPNAQSAMTTKIRDIKVVGNYLHTGVTSRTIGIYVSGSETTTDNTAPYNIQVERNYVYDMSVPFYVQGIRDIKVKKNHFGLSRYSCQLGNGAGTLAVYDADLDGNYFYEVANDNTDGGNAFFLYAGKRIRFRNNTFDDCGKDNHTYNANIVKSTGTITDLEIIDNFFYQPSPNANSWDYRVDAGTVTAGTFRHYGNRLLNVDGGTDTGVHDYIWTPDFVSATYENSWADAVGNFNAVQYWKDASGVVHFRGTATPGSYTQGDTIFHLAAGFRPGKILQFPVVTSLGADNTSIYGTVRIEHSVGDVQVLYIDNTMTHVSFDGVSFYAAE